MHSHPQGAHRDRGESLAPWVDHRHEHRWERREWRSCLAKCVNVMCPQSARGMRCARPCLGSRCCCPVCSRAWGRFACRCASPYKYSLPLNLYMHNMHMLMSCACTYTRHRTALPPPMSSRSGKRAETVATVSNDLASAARTSMFRPRRGRHLLTA